MTTIGREIIEGPLTLLAIAAFIGSILLVCGGY